MTWHTHTMCSQLTGNPQMARKRASGGGRKPRGPFTGKSRMLTTRITPATRAALVGAAKESGFSLSQEIERRLNDSIAKERNRRSDILALAEAIAFFAEGVERTTRKRWLEDAFTGEALRHGVDALVRHFIPLGAVKIPPNVEQAAAMLPVADKKARS